MNETRQGAPIDADERYTPTSPGPRFADDYRVSEHGFDELEEDGILPSDAIEGIVSAVAVEDYPDRVRGPSVLALQQDGDGKPLHVLWAIPAGERSPAVLVTAYRPDPAIWDDSFRQRVKR